MRLLSKMFKTIKRKFFDLLFRNISFPKGCESGLELNWMLKNVCPCCLDEPIEQLSNEEYRLKYPANNVITLGITKIYICDYHLKQLKEIISEEVE